MFRQAELEVKKEGMKRVSDPRTEIRGASGADEKREVEERVRNDPGAVSRKGSEEAAPENPWFKRREPDP
jgi:hypothetical protein